MTTTREALRYPNRLDGVDVSEVQSRIDYARVAAAGFRFAVVKASEGIGYTDPLARKHLTGFRAVGMRAFAYSFLRPSQGDAKGQVQRLWDSMGDEYSRMVIDLETRNEQTPSAKLVAFAEAAADAVLACGALKAVLYTYPSYARALQPELAKSQLGETTHLWMADYRTPEPSVPLPAALPYAPAPWGAAVLWQYSGGKGFLVPGIDGACDRDLFVGDEDAFRDWLGLPPVPELPPLDVA
jgi:lysozyme